MNIFDLVDPEFNGTMSSDELWYGGESNIQLTDVIDAKSDYDHTHDGYAPTDHTHSGYVSSDDLAALEDVVETKADASHSHTEYALTNHSHSDYATVTALDTLSEEVDGKADANHVHTEYAPLSHDHDEYALTTHSHSEYASQSDLDLLEDVVNAKADSTHTHSEYALTSHVHNDYVLQTDFDALESEVDGKANVSHTHDYAPSSHTHDEYSEIGHNHDDDYAPVDHAHTDYATTTALSELSATVSGKANSSHNHDGIYDESGAASNALASANAYTDSKIDSIVGDGAAETLNTIGEISAAIEDNQDAIDLLNSAIGSKANATDLTSHANDTDIHITSAERTAWNAKSNFSGNYNDLTNKPTIPSVDGLATETYVDEKVATVTVESIGALPDTTVIPTVPTNVSAFTNDAGYLTEHQSLVGLATETYVNTQIDAIDIPSALSDLTADSTHRLVTDAEKDAWNAKSDFSGSYDDLTDKPSIPSIAGLATETYVDEAVSAKANATHIHAISEITNLQSALDSKAASGHNHDSVYYTETEVNSLLSGKSDTTHNHDSSYDALGTAQTKANSALASAKEYTDDAIADEVTARDSAIATAKSSAISTAASDATTKISNHNVSTSAHSDIRTLISDLTTKLNNFLDVDDTTTDQLSEVITLINNNKGTLESLTTSKINVSDIVDNLTTSSASKVLSAKQGVAIKTLIDTLQNELDSHTHEIADVNGLQTALDGKAASSHGTHVTYSTTAPVMDGTASVGTASTVARSDHKHPVDTSRASQTDLDLLETVVAGKANASHTHTIANVTNLQSSLDAKQATITGGASTIASSNLTSSRALVSDSSGKVAVSAVTSTELGYLDGVTSNVQTQLDGKSSTSHTHSAATTSAAGLMSASDKSKLDGITASADSVVFSQSLTSGTKVGTITINGTGTDLYAPTNTDTKNTAGSTNTSSKIYLVGATSQAANPQTYSHDTAYVGTDGCLYSNNTKVSVDGHTHNYAASSSAGGAATSANKLNTNAGDANTPVYFANGVPVACTSLDLNTTGNAATATKATQDGSGNTITSYYMPKSGGTFTDNVTFNTKTNFAQGSYVKQGLSGTSGTTGYVKICTIKTTGTYNNKPITFRVSSRSKVDGYIHFCMSSTSTAAATGVLYAYQDPTCTVNAYYVKTADATWDIYLAKSEGYDRLDVQEVYWDSSYLSGVSVTWTNVQADSLPTDYVAFTRTPMTGNLSGNASTATKLATARTISLAGDVTGSVSFDGSANASITATVADDSHNHIISNIDGLQSALDGKSASSHTHTAQSLVSMANALFATSYNGGVEFSYGADSGKNVLTEISNMEAGLHTIYSIAGTTGNPKTTESWRMLVHKTSVTIGWVLAFDASGSIYSNYQSAAGTFKGWRCIYDVEPPILWMGEYWITDTQTVTPSKALSECRNGWVLVWSDYDTENEKATNGDCFTTVIPKWNPNHVKWSGQSFIAAVPTNLASDGTIAFCGKRMYVHDTKITGHTVNDVSPANDVCLRAIYEY